MTRYGSDLVVDLLRAYDIPYLPMNPGASFRGLHDSLVNGGPDVPEMIICTNEKIAVNMAHGYAKVTGRPLASIVHDVVGLMQASMGIYTAYVDQVPVLVLGGTGPMATAQRRPHIEWVHTAFPQGDLVRNFVKWDDQPFDAEGVVDGFARGHQVATTEPGGPVYLCYDLGLQEAPLEASPDLVVHRSERDQQFAASQDALAELAEGLLRAERPAIIAGRVGRTRAASDALVRLAELTGAPVLDLGWRFNLPNTHPLWDPDAAALTNADFVLALDVADPYGALTKATGGRGTARAWLPSSDARIVEMRLDLLRGNGWLPIFQKYQPVDRSLPANTAIALPELNAIVERRRSELGTTPTVVDRMASRRADARVRRERALADARKDWHRVPISTARLAGELWDVVAHQDFVHTGASLNGWVTKLWEFDDWSSHTGRSLGTATQIGTAMGVALAYRDSASKVVVDVQPDGDLLFDPGTLWTIARYRLPLFIVMFNNRSYYNDVEHQRHIARDRDRDEQRAHIGMDLDEPAPDFATLAESFGISSIGPVEDPERLAAALKLGFATVRDERRPFLIDVVTQHR